MNKNFTLNKALRQIAFACAALAMAAPMTQAVAGPMSWLAGERVQGNGNIKKQARELGHFTGVSMALAGNVDVRIGNTEGIVIETDDNLLPMIETVIENGTLKIRPTKKHMNLEAKTMKITVNAKELDRLSLGGSGSIDSDALKGSKLSFELGGSGTINIKGVESDIVSVAVGGSGNFKAGGGSTSKLSISIGGSGDVQAGQLKANEVSVNIGGSGQATVWANNSLSMSVAGSGDVNYYGDPKVSKSVIGSGGAKRIGPAPR